MNAKEKAVRDAAAALDEAIRDATAAGFNIVWPRSAADLPAIAISETRKVAQPEPPAALDDEPVEARSRARRRP